MFQYLFEQQSILQPACSVLLNYLLGSASQSAKATSLLQLECMLSPCGQARVLSRAPSPGACCRKTTTMPEQQSSLAFAHWRRGQTRSGDLLVKFMCGYVSLPEVGQLAVDMTGCKH